MGVQQADGLFAPFVDYFNEGQQATLTVVKKLQEFRNNPDFFHKVCQVAFNTFHLLMTYYPAAANYTKLPLVLASADMHYFYNFLKIPRQFFLPVDSTTIDDNQVKKALITTLKEYLPEQNQEQIENFARDLLEDLLKNIAKIDMSYRSVDQFKEVLLQRIKKKGFDGADLEEINLDSMSVDLKGTLTDKIIALTFDFVDIGCVALFLQTWKLLDTAKWAAQIGQYRGLQWLNQHSLDSILSGVCSAAYGLKLYESVRKLRDDPLTREEKRYALWQAGTATAELVFNGSYFLNCTGYMKINQTSIHVLAIAAKSIGLLEIATRPPHTYFDHVEAAAAG